MRKTIVLLASAALAAPVAMLAAPAEAAHGARLTDCYKTQYGVTVHVRIRDEGSTGRVRVSAPNGKTVFKNRHVKRVVSGVRYSNSIDAHGHDPSYRTDTSRPLQVLATFKLRNGHKINMVCAMR